MSFSVGTQPHPASGIRSAVEHMEPPAHLSDVQLEQLRVGKEQAIAMLDAGAAGDASPERDDLYYRVSISGHGTDPHAVGDQLTVGVSQVTAA